MKALILAAGRGKRMKSLTDQEPKCLVKLKGKPLIEWQLDAIRASGIDQIAVVTGYKSELIEPYNLTKFHNTRWFDTDMVSSLECAEKWLKMGPCIVSYSDIFYEASAVLSLMNCPAPLAVTYDLNWLWIWQNRFDNPLDDAETFLINCSKQIIEIGNKPYSLNEVQGQYMGLLRVTPRSWNQIVSFLKKLSPNSRDRMNMTALLQSMIQSKFPVIGVPYEGVWGEIDTERDLKFFNTIWQD